MQMSFFKPIKQKRVYKEYSKSDWIMVTPRSKKISYGIMLCNHYWYHPKAKVILQTPMENMFYDMIGKNGDTFAFDCLLNGIQKNPFSKLRKIAKFLHGEPNDFR